MLRILIGVLFLLIGTIVYMVDRPPECTYFLYRLRILTEFYDIIPVTFGPIGNYLPDFIHPLSFILITAGIISRDKRRDLIICLFWLVLDCAFELGQGYNTFLIRLLPDWFKGIPFLEAVESYFRLGTFDIYDLIAIFLGAGTGCLVLFLTSKGENHRSIKTGAV